jgi:hypothetical protein
MEDLILLVIPARRFSTAEGLVKQESSAFAFNDLKTLDPSFRWDDEQNQTFPMSCLEGFPIGARLRAMHPYR